MIGLIFAITALIVFEIVIISQSKKAHYKAWKQEFKRELGLCPPEMDDEIIRDLYDSGESPKTMAEYYKESKDVCVK